MFYHRHTNGTNYSRQGCLEKLDINEDGFIRQAEITSCGSVKPLGGEGEYPAYIACNIFGKEEQVYVPWSGWMDDRFAKITQRPLEKGESYIANICSGTTVGFKYFDIKGLKRIAVRTMGYARGRFIVTTSIGGKPAGEIPIGYFNVWADGEAEADIPDGVHALYFTFEGEGHLQFSSFKLICG